MTAGPTQALVETVSEIGVQWLDRYRIKSLVVLASVHEHTGNVQHRHTSQAVGELQPPDSGKAIIFRAKAKFFGQKPAAKNKKNIFFVFFCIY